MRPIAPLDDDDNPCRPRHFTPRMNLPSTVRSSGDRALETSHGRLKAAAVVFMIAFAALSLRLAEVTLLPEPDTKLTQLVTPPVVHPTSYGRADIVDRNGIVLATTLETPSLFANPHLIADPVTAAREIAKRLKSANEKDLLAKLQEDKSFVWLARHVTPAEEYAVSELGIVGLDFQHEERRVYPSGALGAHVVGFSDLDNKGLAGIERSFDASLTSSRTPLKLSIDIRLQAILKEEMQQTIDDFTAIGAMGIVMDLRNGEILSMVSLPDFNPNDLNTAIPANIFNRATLGVYEMGSVFKIYNTAMTLEGHKATLSTLFDTNEIHIGKYTIHDYHPFNRPASVAEIFMESSNIGSARMAMTSGPEVQKEFLGRLGLLRPATIEIPEIGYPEIPHPWHDINTMTIAFGHGLSVSPVQMAVASGAIINGGILRPGTLIKEPAGFVPPGTRVISTQTSEEMRKLLRLVVTEGTGKQADVPGYLVGGKTGTAEKVEHHGYAKKALLSSFIGAFVAEPWCATFSAVPVLPPTR